MRQIYINEPVQKFLDLWKYLQDGANEEHHVKLIPREFYYTRIDTQLDKLPDITFNIEPIQKPTYKDFTVEIPSKPKQKKPGYELF